MYFYWRVVCVYEHFGAVWPGHMRNNRREMTLWSAHTPFLTVYRMHVWMLGLVWLVTGDFSAHCTADEDDDKRRLKTNRQRALCSFVCVCCVCVEVPKTICNVCSVWSMQSSGIATTAPRQQQQSIEQEETNESVPEGETDVWNERRSNKQKKRGSSHWYRRLSALSVSWAVRYDKVAATNDTTKILFEKPKQNAEQVWNYILGLMCFGGHRTGANALQRRTILMRSLTQPILPANLIECTASNFRINKSKTLARLSLRLSRLFGSQLSQFHNLRLIGFYGAINIDIKKLNHHNQLDWQHLNWSLAAAAACPCNVCVRLCVDAATKVAHSAQLSAFIANKKIVHKFDKKKKLQIKIADINSPHRIQIKTHQERKMQ